MSATRATLDAVPVGESTAARGALAALLLAMLMPSLATSIANIALPTLAHAFAAPFQNVQWIVLAYLLAITTLVVGIGRLGDIFGRKRVLLVGIALFTAASVFAGVAPSLGVLIAARAMQGIGAAAMMALTLAFVSETTAKERVGAAIGLLGAVSAIGTALGPSIGGFLLAAFDWRVLFFVNAPLGCAALALAWRFLPADRRSIDTPRFDSAGTLLLALAVGAYALAATVGRGQFGAANIAWLCAAALGLGAFLAVEARAPSPLIRASMLQDRRMAVGLSTNAIVSAVMMTTLIVGPFYLSHALGHGAIVIGLAMSVGPFVAALAGAPAGRLVDRLGSQRMGSAGLAGVGAGCVLLAAAPTSLGLVGYLVPIAILTASYALFQAANNTMLVAGVKPEDRGLVSGLVNLSRNLGLMTGASVMGVVFAVSSGAADLALAQPEGVALGMRLTFGVAVLLVGVAIALIATSAKPWRR